MLLAGLVFTSFGFVVYPPWFGGGYKLYSSLAALMEPFLSFHLP